MYFGVISFRELLHPAFSKSNKIYYKDCFQLIIFFSRNSIISKVYHILTKICEPTPIHLILWTTVTSTLSGNYANYSSPKNSNRVLPTCVIIFYPFICIMEIQIFTFI